MKKNYAIIVDGFSTGSLYAYALKTYGLKCLHVRSSSKFVSFLTSTYNSSLYEKEFIFDGDYEHLLADIRLHINTYEVALVLVGTTAWTGFTLTDKLAQDFGVAGNDPKTTLQRVNKYTMNERLREQGIPSLKQIMASDLEAMQSWAAVHYPVLLKPLESGGSEGIYIYIYIYVMIQRSLQKRFINIMD